MRTQWVFRHQCGCPFGVLEGNTAGSRSKAWREMFATAAERNWAVDRGVTADLIDHDRYAADVLPLMLSGYRCTHGAEG